MSAEVLARTIAEKGSVVRAIDALNGDSQRRLGSFDGPRPNRLVPVEHNALMDPYKPLGRDWRVDSGKLVLASAAILPIAALALFARRRYPLERRASEIDQNHKPH